MSLSSILYELHGLHRRQGDYLGNSNPHKVLAVDGVVAVAVVGQVGVCMSEMKSEFISNDGKSLIFLHCT